MKNKGKKTKEEIVRQSLQLFSQKGYFHTSIQDVLQATGLTKGGLYCHFSGKEALWHACYQEATKIWRTIVFQRVNEDDKAIDKLRKILENDLMEYMGEDTFRGGCFLFNMLIELSGQEPELVSVILVGFRKFEAKLAAILREAIDDGDLPKGLPAEKAAAQIMVILNGTAAIYSAERDKALLSNSLEQLYNYLQSFPCENRNVSH